LRARGVGSCKKKNNNNTKKKKNRRRFATTANNASFSSSAAAAASASSEKKKDDAFFDGTKSVIKKIARKLQSGELTSLRVTEMYLKRMKDSNLNCYASVKEHIHDRGVEDFERVSARF
jgi:hypothetical protein